MGRILTARRRTESEKTQVNERPNEHHRMVASGGTTPPVANVRVKPTQPIQIVLVLQNSRMPWAESSRP